ncbi:putative surface protein with fasciclin (FAS1) repeats [Krasilnikovia cinnamomea]|uniref:Putative surface protein with fasciclin (FAS1) repeats n=1 Tax=Krasilnikovia cinnamomea TaxID=349313 RepID=A0A4Q7ZEX2_9ACTN|nr:putative surface protein with fasciclin (FAS1) repeats [Krasilnikovia cinnamomea]
MALAGCGSGGEVAAPPHAAPSYTAPSVPQFGNGCAAVPADPANPGSFEAMAAKPVASALAGSEGLSGLAEGFKRAGLVSSLNDAAGLTVFAPTDGAFEKLPAARRHALGADKKQLAGMLSGHVVPQRLTPSQLPGSHTTLSGAKVTVTSQGGVVKVNGSAEVVCANVQTKNATVYLVDTVLTAAE